MQGATCAQVHDICLNGTTSTTVRVNVTQWRYFRPPRTLSSCFLCIFVIRDASSCTSVARRGCLPPFFACSPIPTLVSGGTISGSSSSNSSRCTRPSDDHVRCQGRRLSVRDNRSLDSPLMALRNRRRNRQPLNPRAKGS